MMAGKSTDQELAKLVRKQTVTIRDLHDGQSSAGRGDRATTSTSSLLPTGAARCRTFNAVQRVCSTGRLRSRFVNRRRQLFS